jgi:hypothetical protein
MMRLNPDSDHVRATNTDPTWLCQSTLFVDKYAPISAFIENA